MPHRQIIVATALSLLWVLEASASHFPIGAEFRVNTATAGAQVDPAVAMALDGRTVVIWVASQHVYGQRYAANGVPLGTEFQVDVLPIPLVTSFVRDNARVAIDDDGDFVVSWENLTADDDGHTFPITEEIFTRRYGSAGDPLDAAEVSVRSCASSAVIAFNACNGFPTVAMDGDGDFVIAYRDGYSRISARRFDSGGAAQGSAFAVSTNTTDLKSVPSASAASDGRFVVAWTSSDQSGTSSYEIFAQRFDASGTPAGTEFHVNTYTTGRQHVPAVATAANGDFVIVWESAQDGAGLGVFAQRYDSAGAPAGTEFQINSHTTADQRSPSVDSDGSGAFVVVWRSVGQDGDGAGVFGQVFDSAGAAHDVEFQVNTYTPGEQGGTFVMPTIQGVPNPLVVGPRVAAAGDGRFMVTWRSKDQDGSDFGVYAQRFLAALPAVDPLKCYQGRDLQTPPFVAQTIDTGDQLTTAPVMVQKLKFHCASVDVNGAGMSDPARRLTCYQVRRTTVDPLPVVEVTTQFQPSRFALRKPKLVCLPSAELPLP